MKCIVIFCVVMGVMAEPPRFRARFRSQRQELAPTTTDSTAESTTAAATGPYSPSGWKPSGAAFTLPIDTTPTPMDTYGAPDAETSAPYPSSGWKPDGQAFTLPQELTPPSTTYGVPEKSYGVPDNTYGVPDNTYGAPSTDNSQAETLVGPVEVQKSVDTYYILLPNGQLQRVAYVSENDLQNLKYIARLQLKDRTPLLVFGP